MTLPRRRYEDCCGAHKKFSPLCDECVYFRALEQEHAALTAVAEAAGKHAALCRALPYDDGAAEQACSDLETALARLDGGVPNHTSVVEAAKALYPDLRQVIEGLKDETWTEWDESVNQRLMAFGALLFRENSSVSQREGGA